MLTPEQRRKIDDRMAGAAGGRGRLPDRGWQSRARIAAVTDRILLIEDDPRLAEMVKNYLGEAGFHVTVAPKGATGIALQAREAFDASCST